MKITVRVMATMSAGGTEEVDLPDEPPPTVGAVLDALVVRRPGLADRLRTPQGTLQCYVNVFVGPDSIRSLGGLGALVPSGVEVWVVPPGGGG